MSKEVSLFQPHEYKTRTDHRSHFPMGGMEPSHQQDLPRDMRYDVWRQETTDQDTGQPVCEAGGEDKTQVDHTQSVQRVEEQTTEITEVHEVTGVLG